MKKAIIIIILTLTQGIFCQTTSCSKYVHIKKKGHQTNAFIRIPYKNKNAKIDISYTTTLEKPRPGQLTFPNNRNRNYIKFQYILHPMVFQPNIVKININDKIICSDTRQYISPFLCVQSFYYRRNDYVTSLPRCTSEPLQRTPVTTTSTTQRTTTTSTRLTTMPPFNDNSCGYPKKVKKVYGGQVAVPNEFPWLLAILYFNVTQIPKYKCGANLISRTHALTAAHCVENKNDTIMYVEFGRHNLSVNNERLLERRWIKSITSHPGYVKRQAHNDIAVLSFDSIEYSTKIRPICIWTDPNTPIVNGTISGWGDAYNDGSISDVPMKVNLNAVDLEKCRNSHRLLKMIATDRTFCAGGQSTGPCHGDSGSGFWIRPKDLYYLRGIISNVLGYGKTCDLSYYTVYVDVAQYLDWIRDTIENDRQVS